MKATIVTTHHNYIVVWKSTMLVRDILPNLFILYTPRPVRGPAGALFGGPVALPRSEVEG